MTSSSVGSGGAAEQPQHPRPSERARALVRGGYDLHLHLAPDVMPRRITDLELAQRFHALGLAGFAIKSHYTSTAERAAVVRAAVPGVNVLGAITLNRAVGGLNPIAVDIAGREGARIVWMPTFDALNETAGRVPPAPGAKLPFWARIQHELRDQGMGSEPIQIVDESGQVVPDVRKVLSVIARHDMALATGHMGRDEIFAVVKAANEEGVRRIIITHPEFPSQNLSAADQVALADQGAFIEHCLVTAYTGKTTWDTMFANIRAVGAARTFVSTDLGQPDNPPVEDGMALMADFLLQAGFSDDDIRTMTVTNPTRLAEK